MPSIIHDYINIARRLRFEKPTDEPETAADHGCPPPAGQPCCTQSPAPPPPCGGQSGGDWLKGKSVNGNG